MAGRGSETEFELTTIERLIQQEFDYTHGEEIERPHDEVVLRVILKDKLVEFYSDLPDNAIEFVVNRLTRPEGVDTLQRNKKFHEDLTKGFEVPYERDDGVKNHVHVYPINWNEPKKNDFRVVNQFPIHGQNDRRPDIIIFINGLPLIVFELKNPYSIKPSVDDALNQIGHYKHDIPQLFEFNALTVISDGIQTLHGMWTAGMEWYAPWKSIDGVNIEANTTGSMKALVEGLFSKERLLEYLRHFILFEVADEKIIKKGAKYHQFFAVRLAADKTLATVKIGTDKRIGVIWHTTGSGKSLSMAFLVGILRQKKELENPTFVLQVDRTDLDDQLHDQFVAARSLVGDVQHAESVDELRDLLRTEGGEVIFTTIEKFRLKNDENGPTEIEHPVLSERTNIIVIADEAHRSQYGFMEGHARYLTEALPNARRIGFTGTPVSFSSADTVDVFGELIHTYDIKQSQEDRATVPIFYEPRQIKLHLNHNDVDKALSEITVGVVLDQFERKKGQWSALAKAAGTKDRMQQLASDLLAHYQERTSTLDGKAMIVCMVRANCVRLYDELTKLTGCPEVKIIMTGNLGEDPEEWSEAGHLTTKAKRDTIKKRMVDAGDPLKIVIVCDMWLTGTDIPCLHTLYIDKPMKGHNMIQAISRVNRVFEDKPHGLIVDYIGIGDELRDATATYTKGGGKGNPAPSLDNEAIPLFEKCLEEVRQLLPEEINYGDWRKLSHIDLEDRYAHIFGYLTEDDQLRDDYLQAEHRLSNSYLLVKHLDACRGAVDEVIFYQRVRKQIRKSMPGRKADTDVEKAVRDLVDDTVESEGVIDIFETVGIDKPDISILDDDFLQTFKDKPHQNLRLKLLEKLFRDELTLKLARNIAKSKSFRERLEETLKKYHNRLIDAAAVIKAMIEMRKEWEADEDRAKELGLEEEELAFYDAVASNFEEIYGNELLSGLVHDVVQNIKRNLKLDWTEPHRDDIKASIRAAVKRALRSRDIKTKDLEPFIKYFMEQAEALYAEWPRVA
jgi:type I restriction enzyme, R subunit